MGGKDALIRILVKCPVHIVHKNQFLEDKGFRKTGGRNNLRIEGKTNNIIKGGGLEKIG